MAGERDDRGEDQPTHDAELTSRLDATKSKVRKRSWTLFSSSGECSSLLHPPPRSPRRRPKPADRPPFGNDTGAAAVSSSRVRAGGMLWGRAAEWPAHPSSFGLEPYTPPERSSKRAYFERGRATSVVTTGLPNISRKWLSVCCCLSRRPTIVRSRIRQPSCRWRPSAGLASSSVSSERCWRSWRTLVAPRSDAAQRLQPRGRGETTEAVKGAAQNVDG